MEQDYNLKKWSKGCPNTGINCRRSSCGIEYVFIPAALGDDQKGSPVAPKNGSYNNAVVYYEATGNVYLYSSDGVPTRVEKNLDSVIADLQRELNNVEEALSEETTAREAADAALDGRIDTVADNLATETANRISADEDLQADIATETTARQNADTALQNNITAESTTRANADSDLQTNINTVSGNLSAETTARQTADTNLQTQIDAIVASSDVKDIVGTKAELNNYDTTTLGDRDIIKVLNDESQNNETTYYRWSTSTSTFTLIGEEGPYYTKSATDTLLNAKADKSTTYTKTETDTLLATKQDSLTAGSNITISNNTISATDTTYSDFTGTDGTAAGTAGLVPAPATTDAGKVLGADGTWVTGGPTVVQFTGTSTVDVMSQNATTSMVYLDPEAKTKIRIGGGTVGSATDPVVIGRAASVRGDYAVAIGSAAGSQVTNAPGGISLGAFSEAGGRGQMDISLATATQQAQANYGYNGSAYRLLTGLYDPQSDHDAATKGYVDAVATSVAAATVSSQDWSDLWQ